MRRFYLVLLLILITITGCENTFNPTNSASNQSATDLTLLNTKMEPTITDCSKLVIPKETEVNTNVDHEKGVLSVSWYDEGMRKDVSYTIRYTDQDCSKSVKQLIAHVLSDEVSNKSRLSDVQPLHSTTTKNLECKLKVDHNFVDLVLKGQLNGLSVKLGSSKQDILAKLGQPDETGSDNSEYIAYRGCADFYFNDHKHVSAIKVESTAIGLTNNQVKEILKKPLSEGANDEDGGYLLVYEFGDYQLYFSSETKEGEITDLLFKEKSI